MSIGFMVALYFPPTWLAWKLAVCSISKVYLLYLCKNMCSYYICQHGEHKWT